MLRQAVVLTAAVIAGVGAGLALSYRDGWREADLPGEVRTWVAGRLALLYGDSRREAGLPGEVRAWVAGRLALPHGDSWRETRWPGEVGARVAGRLALLHEDGWWKPHWASGIGAWAAGRLASLHGDSRPGAHPPNAAGTQAAGGLGPDAAMVTVMRHHGVRMLSAADANQALALVRNMLPAAGPLTPVPDGPRFLANLRLNEQLVDIKLGMPQSLVVGSRQISAVSGLVIPFTGKWRQRIVVLQTGQVEVSGPLVNIDLIDLEGIVEKEDGTP
jgi:hypothetical protein